MTRPLTRGYAVSRICTAAVATNLALIAVFGVEIPQLGGAHDALIVVAVATLGCQFVAPGVRPLRLAGLCAVWMTLVPRALWLLMAQPLGPAQGYIAASAYFALALCVAGLVVMADLLDGLRA